MHGRWAVVTGASRGIGRGIAERLVAAGASVVMVARQESVLAEAGRQVGAGAGPGQEVVTIAADAADRADIAGVFARLRRDLPRLDVLVANAGTGSVRPFLDLEAAEWDRIMALNLTGTFHCCQEAARMMRDTGAVDDPRAILVISSVRALGVRPGRMAYAVSKAALNQLVRMAAYELAELGIRVNALSPGLTATELALSNPDFFHEQVGLLPLRRAGLPADMGEAALFLVSPAAAFITGANLVADGGESLW